MAKLPDLSKHSIGELKAIIRDAEKKIERNLKEELKAARKAAEDAVKKHGFTLQDITDGKRSPKPSSKPKVPPKYKNPDNPSQTWSGRGRQPEWFKAALESGKTRESMEV